MKKRFNFLIDEEVLKKVKNKAKEQNRSASSLFINSVIETPNLAVGDWWNDPNKIRKIAQEIKKELK